MELSVGDHVVYPPHGAGVVTALEPSPDGNSQLLSISIVHSKMTLKVPLDAAESRGVRRVIAPEDVDAVLAVLRGADKPLPDNPQHRRAHMDGKARTGDVTQLAEIVRDLAGREAGGKKLSPPEQTALATARRHLATEIGYVRGIDEAAAEALLDEALAAAPRKPAE